MVHERGPQEGKAHRTVLDSQPAGSTDQAVPRTVRQLADLAGPALDRSTPVPLYYQLAQTLQGLIESGTLSVGTKLGNEADLARELGVSRPTVRRALGYLAAHGCVLRLRGTGTVVMPVPIRRSVGLTSMYDDLVEGGHRPTTRVLTLKTVPAPAAVQAALSLSKGAMVRYLRRLRFVDDDPLAVMENYLPVELLSLDRSKLEASGLYRVMRNAGITPRVASQTVGARLATQQEAQLLRLDKGAPILQLQRVSYDETGRAIEYASHSYAAARQTFQMNLISDTRAAQP